MKTKTVLMAALFAAITFSGCGSNNKTSVNSDSEGHCTSDFIFSLQTIAVDATGLDSTLPPSVLLQELRTIDTDCTSFFSKYTAAPCDGININTGETETITADEINQLQTACNQAHTAVTQAGTGSSVSLSDVQAVNKSTSTIQNKVAKFQP